MPTDVAAKCPTLFALLNRAASRRTKSSWIIIFEMLMPYIIEFMEKCFENMEQFVEVVQEPNPSEERQLARVLRRGLRDNNEGRPRYRKAMAERMAGDLCTEAAETDQDELAKCYSEISN